MLLKTFAQTENNSQAEEANEEIHMVVMGISLHMVVMELLQKLRAKEKTNSAVICSTFSKSNGLITDPGHEGTSLLTAGEIGGNVREGISEYLP